MLQNTRKERFLPGKLQLAFCRWHSLSKELHTAQTLFLHWGIKIYPCGISDFSRGFCSMTNCSTPQHAALYMLTSSFAIQSSSPLAPPPPFVFNLQRLPAFPAFQCCISVLKLLSSNCQRNTSKWKTTCVTWSSVTQCLWHWLSDLRGGGDKDRFPRHP